MSLNVIVTVNEVNVAYKDRLREAGLRISGQSPDGELTEFVELPREVHPFYVSTQAHPEFKSCPTAAPAVRRSGQGRLITSRSAKSTNCD